MHLTTQQFLFCSILSLKYSLHPPSMFVTLSALIAQPLFLLAFKKKKCIGYIISPHGCQVFYLIILLLTYCEACWLCSFLLSQFLFSPPHPFTFSQSSIFEGIKSHASHLFCRWLFFFCFASPCTSHHLLYFCLPPRLRAQSHLCIHLSALANPLTSPAHSPAFSSLTLLVALSVKGCP